MRLERLQQLISACGASIHDLSRVTLSGEPGKRVPRFNMPLELGMAVQEAFHVPTHSFHIMEAERHRFDRSTSDLKAYDPYIHDNDPNGVLRAVLNALGGSRDRGTPSLRTMKVVYDLTVETLRARKKTGEFTTVFDRSGFKELVAAATVAAAQEGLVPA